MVMYRDYVSDFPNRCSELLDELHFETRRMGREVTHLLSIAAVGLIMPYERLRRLTEESQTPHPSGDNLLYEEAVVEYNSLLDECFLSSSLWPEGAPPWRKGRIKDVREEAPRFVQAYVRAEPIRPEVKVGTIVRIMRNALAHGNIVTMEAGWKINDIMFLSVHKKYPNFRFVVVEPEDLRKFMMNYFKFLRDLDLGRARLVDEAPGVV